MCFGVERKSQVASSATMLQVEYCIVVLSIFRGKPSYVGIFSVCSLPSLVALSLANCASGNNVASAAHLTRFSSAMHFASIKGMPSESWAFIVPFPLGMNISVIIIS